MSHVQWSLQDAKNRFNSVVESARRGKPQIVTKRGIPAVVVLSAEEYERLHGNSVADLRTVFQESVDFYLETCASRRGISGTQH